MSYISKMSKFTFSFCDESAASPLIISTPRPLIAALHQAPDGSGCVREEGRWNSQVWRRVMRHTWRKWSLITAAVICRLRLSSGDRSLPRACTLVSSWVQEGCVEGAAAAPVHGWRARMPGRIIPGGAVARRRTKPPKKPPPLALRTREGSACGRRTPPLTWTLPSRTLPLLHNPRTQRGHQIPCLFWTLYPLWTLLLYYFCLIKASPRPDATPTVSVGCSSRHNLFYKKIYI